MKDECLYLEYILKCIQKIEDYTKMDEARFMESSMIQDAVVRNLQVMAESTQRISEEIKSEYPDVEWRGIAGFEIFWYIIISGLIWQRSGRLSNGGCQP